jgi:hypothetical protein
MLEEADDLSAQAEARCIEIEHDPMRWILDVFESMDHDAADPPPNVVLCESAVASVKYGGRRNRESVQAVCLDEWGDRWEVSLAVDHDAGGYWEQPESDIEASWKRIREDYEMMDANEVFESTTEQNSHAAPEAAAPPEVASANGALAAFEAARSRLVEERARLVEERARIDAQIAGIDAVIYPAKRSAPVAVPVPVTGKVSGPGSTVAIRRMFVTRPKHRVTFAEIRSLVGSASRAGALVQNLIRSKQVKRLNSGTYEATEKLLKLAAEDGTEG